MKKMVQIPGKPSLLVVDATQQAGASELRLSRRVFRSLSRRGVKLFGHEPHGIADPEEMRGILAADEEYNCILLLAHGQAQGNSTGASLEACWEWLKNQVQLSPKLFAACVCRGYDPSVGREILETSSFASIALAPESELTSREAAAFFVKFFYELDIHCSGSISGMMAQFAYAKARHLSRGKMKMRW